MQSIMFLTHAYKLKLTIKDEVQDMLIIVYWGLVYTHNKVYKSHTLLIRLMIISPNKRFELNWIENK